MLKALSTTKSFPSTIPTTSLAKSQTSQTTTKPSSSSRFLEKEKEMIELKAKLLSKRSKTSLAVKTISLDICDPFIAEYRRISKLACGKRNNLSNIFYSGGLSLFARLTASKGANPELIYRFHEFGYLDIIYPDKT